LNKTLAWALTMLEFDMQYVLVNKILIKLTKVKSNKVVCKI
jgi:hypothetical protein